VEALIMPGLRRAEGKRLERGFPGGVPVLLSSRVGKAHGIKPPVSCGMAVAGPPGFSFRWMSIEMRG